MARPRTLSDAQILAVAADIMGQGGMATVTLQAVGAACGLSASTMVQRFGSKRELLLAMARQAVGVTNATFAEAVAVHDSPLEALEVALLAHLGPLTGPVAVAHHLAVLQLDLTDADLRAQAEIHADTLLTAIRQQLQAAMRRGDLQTVPAAPPGSPRPRCLSRDDPAMGDQAGGYGRRLVD